MKKLVRDTNNKSLFGVCAGLAKYFDIDPLIIRIIFVTLLLVGGGGAIIYLLLALLMPKEDALCNNDNN